MAVVRLEPRRRLTPSQELIWTSQRLHPDVPLANMANLSTIDAAIDPDRFVAAVDTVVRGADVLRTVVRTVDGVPHPTIRQDPPRITDVIEVPWTEMDAWCADRIAEPLQIEESVYDSVLIRHPDAGPDEDAPGAWSWWFDCHHVATDAASSATIFRAVAAAYTGEWEPGRSYDELAASIDAAADSPRVVAARQHWLQNAPTAVHTSLYRPDAGPSTAAERIEIDLASREQQFDDLLADRFRLISPDLSLTVALGTVLSAFLSRLGNDRIVIGVPVHHRMTKDDKDVIGPLVELFPVEVEIGAEDTFADVHARWNRSLFSTLRHALPGTSPAQNFDVVLNVHGATFGMFGDHPTRTTWVHPGHIDAHHRLRMQALDYDGSGALRLAVDINHRAADADHRRRAADHIAAVLDAVIADPDMLIADVSLRTDDEAALLAPFETQTVGTPLEAPAPEIVSRRLRTYGERSMMRLESESGEVRTWTGAEIDSAIDGIVARLGAADIGPGDLVGIEMPLGPDAVLAIHGVLRSGAAFVPIDPTYPEARREHLRTDSGCALVLRSLEDLPPAPDGRASPMAVEVDSDALAYVIYTSGSTGLPKGVPITHRGLREYLGFAYTAYVGDHAPVMPLFTSLSFDLTITTLFLPFLAGGQLTVHPAGGIAALREIADQRRVTTLKATPSHLELLVRMIDATHPLDTLIVGGEAFLTDLADRLVTACAPGLAIHNEYGPTEAVVGCMDHLYDPSADPGPEVPIGHAAPGVGLRIVDPAGQDVPLGVAGELLIARPGLTAGYLGRPELNAERFVRQSGRRWYRTGDLVRMLDADRMVYLGRLDEQVKIGGIRLEPAEIEHAALSVPGVRRAVAGLWRPSPDRRVNRCVRCGLGDDVPDIVVDADGVCSACHAHDLVAPQAASWFRTVDDLRAELADARGRSTGDYDVLHLLSGGKDSTYALHQLVELGARVRSITLDNGFISDGAKENVRRATERLGVDHEFVTVDAMNEIFRDSLDRFSNVCQGCYKTIYTVALATADRLGIPAIVTGLSRGQFFETRLVPGMFEADRFDPDVIDRAVLEARRVYHQTPDAVSDHLDTTFLAPSPDGDIFDRITFIDFYRYVDVPLAEMYETLEATGTWERPTDTGRSTNCLINAAGIHVHQLEQAHHNYALPYSWDVRLGHKTRDEALFELDDPMGPSEMAEITEMLAEVGYEPRPAEVLTLWVETETPVSADTAEAFLAGIDDALRASLPSHAVPKAIEIVDATPLSPNGKVDMAALPAPAFRRRAAEQVGGRPPRGASEELISRVWCSVLGVADVSATSDFFAIGGTSLSALEMIIQVSDRAGVVMPESVAFTSPTIEALAAELDSRSVDELTVVEALPADPPGPSPLSPGEEAMLYEWRRDPFDRRYNVARLHQIDGPVDVDRFDDAVRRVVGHQPALHRSFGSSRRDLGTAAIRIGRVHGDHANLDELAARINDEAFDLVNGPLVTVHHLSSAVDDATGILLRAHHAVVDAGSLDVMWAQIDLAYQGRDLPELATTTTAHGIWQRANLPDPAVVWNPDEDSQPARLLVRPRRRGPDGYVHHYSTVTMPELRAAPGTTPFASALTALTVALRPRLSSGPLEIAVTSSVRDHPDLANVVGYFLNPLPLLIDDRGADTWRARAGVVSQVLLHGLENRRAPIAQLIRSARERGIPEPTGTIMLAVEDLAPTSLGGHAAPHRILASGTAVSDCTFFVQIRGDSIELGCEYRGDVLGADEARALVEAFDAALHSIVADPDGTAPVDAGVIVSGDTLATDRRLAPQRIDDSIAAYGTREAVACGGDSQTYAELDEAARAIAGRLRALGVVAGDRVGVVLERSVDLPSAIRGCWLLGASYVPIDISTPAARVTELLTAADVTVAITSGELHPGLREVLTVRLDVADRAVLPVHRTHECVGQDEAYVIFTSGSTGRPKGVPITHANLASSLAARLQYYERPVDRYLLVSSAGFDSSIAGLFWTLADGGCLVFPTENEVHDIDALVALIDRHHVTHTLCVPSLYGGILRRARGELATLETVIVAGEACSPDVVAAHETLCPRPRLINEYGPTEATVWATAHRVAAEDLEGGATVPIGAPIPGTSVIVVEPTSGRRLPIDVPGELWIAGPGVASGYLRTTSDHVDAAPDAVFVDTDLGQTYRTGDRVVARSDGTIDFVGRIDDQLSVGGVRVEPREIEHVLTNADPAIVEAGVTVVDGSLVAMIEGSTSIDTADLAAEVARRLPPALVPQRIALVDALPRTPNGKLDRDRLVSVDLAVVGSAPPGHKPVRPPSVGQEGPELTQMCSIWESVFGRRVAPDDDFFELGGDSLVAVALVTEIEETFGVRVGIGELIDTPTPRGLLPRIANAEAGEATTSAEPSASAESSLVEWLRGSGDESPLVVLPPGGGNLLRYEHLVRELDPSIPVVGLRLPGADARSDVLTTIQDQASAMLEALDSAVDVPRSGHVLLGWSTGGLLAWEIARLLLQRGDAVAAVVLVDTVMGGMHVEAPESPADKYRRLLRSDGPGTAAREAAGRLRERTEFALARRRYRQSRDRGGAPTAIDAERQLGPVIRAAALGYLPPRLDVPVLYVSASESDDELTTTPWTTLCAGSSSAFEVLSIDGVHFEPAERGVLGPNNAQAVGAAVYQLIRSARPS